MKTIFISCGVILIVGGVLLWQAYRMPDVYGEFTGAPKAEILDVIKRPEDFLHKTVALEGEVVKQCETMGCFFFFVVGDKELRVDLAEIAMNAPKDRDGDMARVEGRTVPYNNGYQFMASAVEFE